MAGCSAIVRLRALGSPCERSNEKGMEVDQERLAEDSGVSGGGSGTPKPLARDLVHAPEKDRSKDSA